ncbi:MAG: hypothetical protein ACQEWU_11970 [Bacillota bacterium]|uniref:Uncharacterized protein n=1 Tax=Virgibacillus salarius TaxID=447199 RepID=A0A941DYH7_9BACI|nr:MULTISPECIES: hypothetical protein [Bacillaceae]MBR7797429.1 hypothetical protein [Virgibacillus salarius]NAZ10141.1 hypothetical protein [Agaribacter marinus]
MQIKEDEKALRFQGILQEVLKPIAEKLKTIKEIESVRNGQEELKKMVEERQRTS